MTRDEYKAEYRIFRCKLRNERAKRPENIGYVTHEAKMQIVFHGSTWPQTKHNNFIQMPDVSIWRFQGSNKFTASLLYILCSGMFKKMHDIKLMKMQRRYWLLDITKAAPLPLP